MILSSLLKINHVAWTMPLGSTTKSETGLCPTDGSCLSRYQYKQLGSRLQVQEPGCPYLQVSEKLYWDEGAQTLHLIDERQTAPAFPPTHVRSTLAHCLEGQGPTANCTLSQITSL